MMAALLMVPSGTRAASGAVFLVHNHLAGFFLPPFGPRAAVRR